MNWASSRQPCAVRAMWRGLKFTVFLIRCQQGWQMMSLLSSSMWTPMCWALASRKSKSGGNAGSVTESHVFLYLPLTDISVVTHTPKSATVPNITGSIWSADIFGFSNMIHTEPFICILLSWLFCGHQVFPVWTLQELFNPVANSCSENRLDVRIGWN